MENINTKRQIEEYLQKMTYRLDSHTIQRPVFTIGKGLDLEAEMSITSIYNDKGYPVKCILFSLALVDNEEKENFAYAFTFLGKVGDIEFDDILGQLNKSMKKRLEEMREKNDEGYERVAELAGRAAFVLFD